ncbi:uncharacterized protein FIBRA_00876 [Fibroporia radiculosa]|uniref:Uncharacterized protein n=1 Tax=Fibroporia radiculosa TaxID=599839 RepID=J4H0S7_9APHY|nr:uncharacterized protein FIBRA_00876 [Fibroporia radiculosa]CCL98869.1 predicted protein [Fibroporia radiculosa]
MSQSLQSIRDPPDAQRVAHQAAFDSINHPVSSGGEKHRNSPLSDGQNAWAFSHPDAHLAHSTTTPSTQQHTPMFAPPPMFYDPGDVAVQQSADYQQWVENYNQQGAQYAYPQGAHPGNVPHFVYQQQQQQQQQQTSSQPQPQQMQDVSVGIMEAQPNQFGYDTTTYSSTAQVSYDQPFMQRAAVDRPQRAMPRQHRRPTASTGATVQYQSAQQQMTQHLSVPAIDTSFQQYQTFQQPEQANESFTYAAEQVQSAPAEQLPHQEYSWKAYEFPETASGAPSTTAFTPPARFSTSPALSPFTDEGQPSYLTSNRPGSAGTSLPAAPASRSSPSQPQGAGKRMQDKRTGAGSQSKKRVRTSGQESEQSDDEGFPPMSITMPPSSGHDHFATRLYVLISFFQLANTDLEC